MSAQEKIKLTLMELNISMWIIALTAFPLLHPMFPVTLTGLPASLSLCKTRKIPRAIVPFSVFLEMLCILKEDGKGEVKVENEEDEESNAGKGGGAAGKNGNSVFSKASQVGI